MSIPQDDEGGPKPITGLGAYFEAPAEPLELDLSPPRPLHKSLKKQKPSKKMASPRRPVAAAAPRPPAANPVFAVGKVAAKKSRMGSSPKKPSGAMLGASTSRQKVIPPMETEVMQAVPAISTTASLPSLIVPNSFVLPPPSPFASIPPHQPELLPTKPLAALELGEADELPDEPSLSEDIDFALDALQPTPKKSFPVAKPFAQHMIHAYSPARPSPLSRILQLAQSPAQSMAAHDNDIDAPFRPEVGDDGTGSSTGSRSSGSGTAPAMSLEDELSIEEFTSTSEESPLRAKNARIVNKSRSATKSSSGGPKTSTRMKPTTTKGPVRQTGRETDKENGATRVGRSQVLDAATRQSSTAKPLLTGKGGARRVPIGSVDAAPIGPGWK